MGEAGLDRSLFLSRKFLVNLLGGHGEAVILLTLYSVRGTLSSVMQRLNALWASGGGVLELYGGRRGLVCMSGVKE